MSKKSSFIIGSIVLLAIILTFLLLLPGLIFSNGQKSAVTSERPYIPGEDTASRPEPPKQEIKQVFERRWDFPLDSCNGSFPYFWQIRFEPLPQINQSSKIYVSLRSCWDLPIMPEGAATVDKWQPLPEVRADESALDISPLMPQLRRPIKKGDIYEGSMTIIPRDIGKYKIFILGLFLNFGFDESGKLVHLSDRGSFPISDEPNHPAITDKEVYVKFDGKYVTNLFHIYPPLSLKDTSTVDYRVVTKVDYPEGLKLITRDGADISFKMLPGPIHKGDTLEGSFKAVPPRVGWNSIGLGVEEPPRQGIKPQNDSFSAQYHLLKDGKLLFIAKGQKGYRTLSSYYAKKGVQLEK